MKKTIRKNEKGITLIALVITVIVLIILAAISIMMISGNDGILARAGNAKVTIGQATAEEEVKRAIMSLQIDGKGNNNGITPEKIAEQVNKDNGRTDVTAEGESFPTNIVYGDGTKVYVDLDMTVGKKENKIYSVDVDEKDIHDDLFIYDEFVKASETEISSTGTLDNLPKNTAVITGIKPEYTQTFKSSIGDNNFYGYEIKYSEVTNTLVIPSTVEKDGVQYTIIGVNLSEKVNGDYNVALPNIDNIIFPNTIKRIMASESNGYFISSTVTNVVLPEYITELPNSMFAGCNKLQNISIPNGVTIIGSNTFSGCTNLQNVIIPDSVTSIGNSVFQNCTGLTDIPNLASVGNIGILVFDGCTGLTNITIPDGITIIFYGAFERCSNLQNVTIPKSVESINESAFKNCTLNKIIINKPKGSFDCKNWKLKKGTTTTIVWNDGEETVNY